MIKSILFLVFLILFTPNEIVSQDYIITDTGQNTCYDTLVVIPCPQSGEPFYGQDSQYDGTQFSFLNNNNGTITDLNTGLIWQQFLFENKFTYEEALAIADTFSINGFDDWRLPSIKEIYSLIDYRGMTGLSVEESIPFIDTTYFEFRYGNLSAGERFIDAQYVSSTAYVGTTMNGDFTVFGVNFADGRIKGYGTVMPGGIEKLFEVRLVRGNENYGINDFVDNGDGTITDNSTGLLWSKYDNGTGLNWEEALDWAYQKNQENYLGYNDWRLPNAKELQSIVDYSRCPQTTNSAAIDTIFNVTPIIDEGGETNYPFYWTNTTHPDGNEQNRFIKAVYIAFGEALGFMEIPPNSGNYVLMDVHGAGAQRSDPKQGDPENYPHGFGPQGDVIRIYNYIRLVRGGSVSEVEKSETGQLYDYKLEQNYPNPFNPSTTISFSIQYAGNITLKIFNVLGNETEVLVNKFLPSGKYSFVWNAERQPSGVYFYQLNATSYSEMKKMILIR
ncbi:MAG: DUF1566 domain-containing protein [Ignavibacteriaceae bacterium]